MYRASLSALLIAPVVALWAGVSHVALCPANPSVPQAMLIKAVKLHRVSKKPHHHYQP